MFFFVFLLYFIDLWIFHDFTQILIMGIDKIQMANIYKTILSSIITQFNPQDTVSYTWKRLGIAIAGSLRWFKKCFMVTINLFLFLFLFVNTFPKRISRNMFRYNFSRFLDWSKTWSEMHKDKLIQTHWLRHQELKLYFKVVLK
jgi:hypothetical protein